MIWFELGMMIRWVEELGVSWGPWRERNTGVNVKSIGIVFCCVLAEKHTTHASISFVFGVYRPVLYLYLSIYRHITNATDTDTHIIIYTTRACSYAGALGYTHTAHTAPHSVRFAYVLIRSWFVVFAHISRLLQVCNLELPSYAIWVYNFC